jgi:hypothetical protein
MHAARLTLCLLLALAAAGCNRFPDVKATTTDAARDAPRPVLTEITPVVAAAQEIELDAEAQQVILDRAKDLQARSAAATSPVIAEDDRQRILETSERLRAMALAEQEARARLEAEAAQQP